MQQVFHCTLECMTIINWSKWGIRVLPPASSRLAAWGIPRIQRQLGEERDIGLWACSKLGLTWNSLDLGHSSASTLWTKSGVCNLDFNFLNSTKIWRLCICGLCTHDNKEPLNHYWDRVIEHYNMETGPLVHWLHADHHFYTNVIKLYSLYVLSSIPPRLLNWYYLESMDPKLESTAGLECRYADNWLIVNHRLLRIVDFS